MRHDVGKDVDSTAVSQKKKKHSVCEWDAKAVALTTAPPFGRSRNRTQDIDANNLELPIGLTCSTAKCGRKLQNRQNSPDKPCTVALGIEPATFLP